MTNKGLTKKQMSEAMAELGRRGGAENFKRHGRKHMSKIGKLAAKIRWKNKGREKIRV